MLVSLSQYKLVFMSELIVALALTTYPLRRREHFTFRVFWAAVLLWLLAYLFPLGDGAVYISFLFISLFCFAVAALCFCFQESLYHLVYCGMIAYTAQHIAYLTYNFVITITGIQSYGSMYQQAGDPQVLNPWALIAYYSIYCITYWAVWAHVYLRISESEGLEVEENRNKLFLSVAVVLGDVILNAVIVVSLEGDPNPVTLTAVYIQSVLCCILAIGIQLTMLDKAAAVKESEKIQELWEIDRQQYEKFRESVELINIKCHDLKHQIRALRRRESEISREALKEIEQAISIYNCKNETGNQVLDTILAEKSLLCEHEHIRFTYIADGAALKNISAGDLYSLFGNAISNAVEAVRKTDVLDQRVIRLSIVRKNDMAVIHLENYCADTSRLLFSNGLPQTTKEDNGFHGYGMRSMQMLAEKLGGGMEVHISENLFHLNIILPAGKESVQTP